MDYVQPFDQAAETAVKAVFADQKKVTSRSKLDRYASMYENERKIKMLGLSIAGVIAVLALCNYLNVTAAGVQNRAKEFATLESIGMTTKQIYTVLCIEGACYGIFSASASFAVGIPFSHFVYDGLLAYSAPYAVPVKSNFLLYTAAVALCMAVPVMIYQRTQRVSVIERMYRGEE